MKNKPLPLTDDEILRLQQIVRKGTDWRSRNRAETLLRLARGESVQAVADALEICKKTVYERRLTLYFLPPYSPELNRIEILWRKIKYEWLDFRKHARVELEEALDRIQAGFGKDYNLTFC